MRDILLLFDREMQETFATNNLDSSSEAFDAVSCPKSWLPWVIWLIGAGFVIFQLQLQLCSGPIVGQLMHSFSITAFGAGILSSTHYYVYILMQIPAGMLIDRFGARKLLGIGGAVCTAGCFIFSSTHNLMIAELGRILMGGGSSFAFVGALFLIGRWFPPKRFSIMMSIGDSLAAFFSLIANVAIAVSIESLSWRNTVVFAGFIALSLTLLNWFFVQDNPSGKKITVNKIDFYEFVVQVKMLLGNTQIWLHGIYIGILFGVLCVFSGLWGIPFIQVQEHVSNTQATLIASLAFAGLGVGCPIMGWLFPKTAHLRAMFTGSALVAAVISIWIIYFAPSSFITYSFLVFILGGTVSIYIFGYSIVQTITKPEIRTTANGFINTLSVLGVPIMQPLVGYILHQASSHYVVNGQEIYTLHNYEQALIVIPLSLIAAAIIPFWLDFSPLPVMLAQASIQQNN